jgi:WD40 repeat protein
MMLDRKPVIVTAGDDGTVRFWELPTLHQMGEPIVNCQSLRAIAAGAIAGRKVVATGENWEVRIWDLEHRTEAIRRLQPHLGVFALVMGVIAGEQVIVAGGYDQRLRVWSPDGRLRHEIDLDAVVTNINVMPPHRIICATTKGMLCLDFG